MGSKTILESRKENCNHRKRPWRKVRLLSDSKDTGAAQASGGGGACLGEVARQAGLGDISAFPSPGRGMYWRWNIRSRPPGYL